MNVSYIIKKCRGFGYATSLKDVKMNKIGMDGQVIYIKDPDTRGHPKGSLTFTSVDVEDYETVDRKKPTLFLIEVGVPCKKTVQIDVEMEDSEVDSLVDSVPIDLDISDELKASYRGAVKELRHSLESYLKIKVQETFLIYLEQLYPHVRETRFQRAILRMLVANKRRVDLLINRNPMNYTYAEEDSVRPSGAFSDVKVSDPYFERSKTEMEDSNMNGVMREFSSQAISKFNGFGNQFAQVDNSKKRAALVELSPLRNHSNIHALARTKIVATPKVMRNCAFNRLVKMLSSFDDFAVIFIWPCFRTGFAYSTIPTPALEVDISEGNVILAVAYRYMLIHFYGLHGAVSCTDYHLKYML